MSSKPSYSNVLHISANKNTYIKRIRVPTTNATLITGSRIPDSRLEELKQIPNVFHSCTKWGNSPILLAEAEIRGEGYLDGFWLCYRFKRDSLSHNTNALEHLRIRDKYKYFLTGDLYLFKLASVDEPGIGAEYADMSEIDAGAEYRDMLPELMAKTDAMKLWRLLRDVVKEAL